MSSVLPPAISHSVATETHDWEVVRWASDKVDALGRMVRERGEDALNLSRRQSGETGAAARADLEVGVAQRCPPLEGGSRQSVK